MNEINITRIDLNIADIDLNNPDILGSSEAAEIWGVNPAYVRTSIKQTPQKWSKHNYRKFDRFLLVTSEGMESATGVADPRKVNSIQAPNGIEMDYATKESAYKNAKTKAFKKCKDLDGGKKDNLNQYFHEELQKTLSEVSSKIYDETHRMSFITDTASFSVEVDGEENLVSNGGIDGATNLEVIEKVGADSDWVEDKVNGKFRTQKLEGKKIIIDGLPLILSGRFQCWAQNYDSSTKVWIVKQA